MKRKVSFKPSAEEKRRIGVLDLATSIIKGRKGREFKLEDVKKLGVEHFELYDNGKVVKER